MVNETAEFQDKVVIVTGGARGIGKATAIEFGKQGATVVIVDLLEKELKEGSETIRKMGMKVLSLKADVCDSLQVEDVIKKTVDNFGKIDILINNVGIVGPTVPIINLPEEDWERIFRVNLKSMFLLCKSVVPIMLKNRKGIIVNLSSIAGKEGTENMGAYSASKAGVIGFSRVLAKEVAMNGIRVNCVVPATIQTELASTLPKEIIDALVAKVPIGRIGYPEEVANLILFLSSEKSSFITGQCINVTGGRGYY